ncbi:MAG: lipase [Stackebrandtia sp.]
MATTRRSLLFGAAGVAAASLPLGLSTAHADKSGGDHGPYVPRLARPTGRFKVGRVDLHLKDESRRDPWVPDIPYRELMISLWYPARHGGHRERAAWVSPMLGEWINQNDETLPRGLVDMSAVLGHALVEPPAAHGSHPVLVYGPGHFQSRTVWTIEAEELASHGYAVLAVDHTYEGRVEFPGGRFEDSVQPTPEDPIGWLLKTGRTWVDDAGTALAALDTLAAGGNPDADGKPIPSGLSRTIDMSRIGAFGAAVGSGMGAMQLAYDNDRVQAVYSGDSWLSFDTGDGREPIVTFHERGLRQPLLVMRPTNEYRDVCPYYDPFFDKCDGPKWELELRGTGFMSQSDLQALLPDAGHALDLPDDEFAHLIGNIEPRASIAAQRAYARAFFDCHLRGRDGELLDGPSPRYPQVRFAR